MKKARIGLYCPVCSYHPDNKRSVVKSFKGDTCPWCSRGKLVIKKQEGK